MNRLTHLSILLLLIFSYNVYAVDDCIVNKKSESVILILTVHTVVYTEPKLCKPLPIVGFSATKAANTWDYSLNWSKQDHDLWHVANYEVRVDGQNVTTYNYDQQLPLSIDLNAGTAPNTLHQFEVRACASIPTDDPLNPLTSCGDWQSMATQCDAICVDSSLTAPSLSGPPVSTTGDYTLSWFGFFDSFELQEKIAGTSNNNYVTKQDNANLYRDFNNPNGSAFTYRVRGHNGNVYSPYSNEFSVDIRYTPSVPSITSPQNNAIITTDNYTVEWTPSINAISYALFERFNGLPINWGAPVSNTNATSVIFPDSVNGNYSYKVVACNGNDACSNSSSILNIVVDRPNTEPAPDPTDQTTSVSADSASDKVGTTSGVFDIDESGNGNYSLPIFAPTGLGGMTPQLALGYNSASGNGIAGVGWNISGASSITRCLKSPEHDPNLTFYPSIKLTDDDALCIDGMRMFKNGLDDDFNMTYRTEMDGFSQITAIGTAGNGPSEFKIITKGGEIRTYGAPDNAFKGTMIANGTGAQIISNDGLTVHTWLLNEISDRSSITNSIYFIWDTLDGENYLSSVKWTNPANNKHHYQVDFGYIDNRPDATHHYGVGVQYKSNRYLDHITTLIRSAPSDAIMQEVRYLKLTYEDSASVTNPSGMLRLASIKQCRDNVESTCVQPVEFQWDEGNTEIGVGSPSYTSSNIDVMNEMGSGSFKPIDINGDGVKELIFVRNYDNGGVIFENLIAEYYLAVHYVSGTPQNIPNHIPDEWDDCKHTDGGYWNRICKMNIQPYEPENNKIYFDQSSWFVYDFDGDGMEEIMTPVLISQGNSQWYIYKSDGAKLLAARNTNIVYSNNEGSLSSYVVDLTNDGLPDLITSIDAGVNNLELKIHKGFIDNNGLTYSSNHLENQFLDVNVDGILKDIQFGVADFNGDGYSDSIINYSQLGTGQEECDSATNRSPDDDEQLDIDCETFYYGIATYLPSNGVEHAQLNMVKSLGIYNFIYANESRGRRDIEAGTIQYMDVNGDGLTDMVYGTYI